MVNAEDDKGTCAISLELTIGDSLPMTSCGYDEAYHRIWRGISQRLWRLDDGNDRTRVFVSEGEILHFKPFNNPLNLRAYGSDWPSPSGFIVI